jgi:2-methylisocitrate lyase-like PEP mutase family enzyme
MFRANRSCYSTSGTREVPRPWQRQARWLSLPAVSEASGYSDGEHTPLTFAIDNLRRITEATELPVTVDVESGYGDTPRKVGETIALAIKAGAIGCNLEDSFPENGSLRETKHQVERIRHARQKADETDVSFFINARTDVFIQVSQDEHNASLVRKALARRV